MQQIIDNLTAAIQDLESLRETAMDERIRPTLDADREAEFVKQSNIIRQVVSQHYGHTVTVAGLNIGDLEDEVNERLGLNDWD